MSIIKELWKNEKAEEDAKKTPEQREEESTKIGDILHDEEDSKLFRRYLEGQGGNDRLLKNLEVGTLRAEDFEGGLEEKKKGFLQTKRRIEGLEKGLDMATIQELIDRSPQLKKLSGALSAEEMHTIVEKNFAGMAMQNPSTLAGLEAAMKKKNKKEENATVQEKEIEDFLSKNNIRSDEFAKAMRESAKNPDAIKELLSKPVGFLQAVRNKIKYYTGGKSLNEQVKELKEKAEALEKVSESLKKDMKSVGGLLATTFSRNEEILDAFNAAIKREDPTSGIEKEASYKEAQDMVKKAEIFMTPDKVPAIKAAWRAFWFAYQKKNPAISKNITPEQAAQNASYKSVKEEFSSGYLTENIAGGKKPAKGFGTGLFNLLMPTFEKLI